MKTTYRVMKTGEWGGTTPMIAYRVACDCHGRDCDLMMDYEIDHDYHILNFYKKLEFSAHDWGKFSIIKTLWNKLKAIKKILFNGYIEVESNLIIRGEEHIQNFINALEEGKRFIDENKRTS